MQTLRFPPALLEDCLVNQIEDDILDARYLRLGDVISVQHHSLGIALDRKVRIERGQGPPASGRRRGYAMGVVELSQHLPSLSLPGVYSHPTIA